MKRPAITLLSLLVVLSLSAGEARKAAKIKELRHTLAQKSFGRPSSAMAAADAFAFLQDNGRFSDLHDKELEIERGGYALSADMQPCVFINDVARDDFERIWIMAETLRGQQELNTANDTLSHLLKAIVYYGRLENERNDLAPGRFHASCFATPRAAAHIYFCLFALMERVEAGLTADTLAVLAHQKLLDVAFQSWKQPLRHDPTDHNIVSVERFRKHVWWVGGNALDYRPVFETALLMRSIPMVDVMSEVAWKSLSCVSQTTYDQAFWTEGITADGAGWGHGRQCLVWGYPIDGLKGTFRILGYLKDSPWARDLKREHIETLFNYIRGSSYYHYKGIIPPLVDRGNMIRKNNRQGDIPSYTLAATLLNDWRSSLTEAEVSELEAFIGGSHPGGVRYFYNNDDVIKKTPDYYLFLNMASNRVDGLESAYPVAAGFNFYSADGVTLFQRDGSEYRQMLGAMKLTAWPGVTTRQTPVALQPIENWRGFTSKHNFAGGAGNNRGSFAAGFIYEKMNGSYRDAPEFAALNDKNKEIYGVLAYKSYFMFDDLFLALGCGITNLMPQLEGDITTTIEQTFSPQPPTSLTESTHGLSGVRHNGFTYAVVPQHTTGQLRVAREIRPTHWQRLTTANREPETETPVFQMEINHGRHAQDATYAYLVNCKGSISENIPVVLSNTTALQAAESADGRQVGAVFYDSAPELQSRMGHFAVSHPAVVFIEQTDDRLRVTVTDARMNPDLNELTLTTNIPITGDKVAAIGKKRFQVTISLPGEPHRGAPVSTVYTLDRK